MPSNHIKIGIFKQLINEQNYESLEPQRLQRKKYNKKEGFCHSLKNNSNSRLEISLHIRSL